jgi:hypothetical protein
MQPRPCEYRDISARVSATGRPDIFELLCSRYAALWLEYRTLPCFGGESMLIRPEL